MSTFSFSFLLTFNLINSLIKYQTLFESLTIRAIKISAKTIKILHKNIYKIVSINGNIFRMKRLISNKNNKNKQRWITFWWRHEQRRRLGATTIRVISVSRLLADAGFGWSSCWLADCRWLVDLTAGSGRGWCTCATGVLSSCWKKETRCESRFPQAHAVELTIIRRRSPQITRARWRANNCSGSRLNVLHVDLHRHVSEEEVAQTHSADHRNKQPPIVDHHSQHQCVAEGIVQQENARFSKQFEEFLRECHLRTILIGHQQICCLTWRTWDCPQLLASRSSTHSCCMNLSIKMFHCFCCCCFVSLWWHVTVTCLPWIPRKLLKISPRQRTESIMRQRCWFWNRSPGNHRYRSTNWTS